MLVGVILVSLNLRVAVAAVSPVLHQVRVDVPFSDEAAGLLGTIPVLAFAFSGLLAPMIGRRFGLEPVLLVATAVSAAGEITRAMTNSAGAFIALSAVALLGMGFGNVLIPPLIKRYFPDRIAVVMAVFTTFMCLSTTLPPMFAVSLSHAFGWRLTLASWSVFAVAALVPWSIVIARSVKARRQDRPFLDASARAGVRNKASEQDHRGGGRPYRSKIAWGLALCLAVNALNSYVLFAWLPQILMDAGVSESSASACLAILTILGIPCALVLPLVAARISNPTPLLFAFNSLIAISYAGLFLAPASAPVVWAVCAGVGIGGFPLLLTLINLRTRTFAGATALSGFSQGMGYLLAAGGPLLVGVLHSRTGSWGAPFGFLAATLVVGLLAATVISKPSMLEDTWLPRRS